MTTEVKEEKKIEQTDTETPSGNIPTAEAPQTAPPVAHTSQSELSDTKPQIEHVGEHAAIELKSDVAEAGVQTVGEPTHLEAVSQNLKGTGATITGASHPPVLEPSGLIQIGTGSPQSQILHRPDFGSPSESSTWKHFSSWVNKLRSVFQKKINVDANPANITQFPAPQAAQEVKKAA